MKRFLSLLFLAALLPGSALFALDFMMSDGWPAVRPDGNPRIWDFEGDERP